MKTLVIHPDDRTTDVLKIIYENHLNDPDWTIVNDCIISNPNLRTLIKEHDRVIIMGHGTPSGLLNPVKMGYYIIDSSYVQLLREKKECVYIWCNADQFIDKYGLNNCFYTGMIISEEMEADYCGVEYKDDEVDFSNVLFAESIRDYIDLKPELLCENSIRDYDIGNNTPVMEFNRKRMYFNE